MQFSFLRTRKQTNLVINLWSLELTSINLNGSLNRIKRRFSETCVINQTGEDSIDSSRRTESSHN